jgi:hypothetical protein
MISGVSKVVVPVDDQERAKDAVTTTGIVMAIYRPAEPTAGKAALRTADHRGRPR